MATPPSKAPLAGGSLLAISLLAGAFIGAREGQATIGFLVGLATGLALLGLVWLLDRSRR